MSSTHQQERKLSVLVKWNKQSFRMELQHDSSHITTSFEEWQKRLQELTGVPIERQKLISKILWKGTLKHSPNNSSLQEKVDLIKVLKSLQKQKNPSDPILVTLLGSAEVLVQPKEKTHFVEDLTPEQIQQAQHLEYQAALEKARGMIPALQFEPQHRDDNKVEVYQYNHFVKGLPQRHIEDLLEQRERKRAKISTSSDEPNTGEGPLLGQVGLTMGVELRRGFVNDLAVLNDGTLLSGLEDGHIQFWKHGRLQNDIVHLGSNLQNGGVRSLVSFQDSKIAFASTANGSIQFWDDDGESLFGVRAAPIPGMVTPSRLLQLPSKLVPSDSNQIFLGLATHFDILRPPTNPSHMFRLPPQNDTERQRRAIAEAQEAQLQASLQQVSTTVQIWFSVISNENSASPVSLQSKLLTVPEGSSPSYSITCMEILPKPTPDGKYHLVVGDTHGGLRLWKLSWNQEMQTLDYQHISYTQLVIEQDNARADGAVSVVTLKYLHSSRKLAVSTTPSANRSSVVHSSTQHGLSILPLPCGRAVHLLDVDISTQNESVHPTFLHTRTLNGHANDSVHDLLELPIGDLITAGSKMDATLQVWQCDQLVGNPAPVEVDAPTPNERVLTRSKQIFKGDIGFVNALEVLSDHKEGSNSFAVAVGRYNLVKVVL